MMMMMMMIYIYTCIHLEVDNEIKSDSVKKVEKKSKFDEFINKVNAKCFGFNNLLQGVKYMKSVV